MSTSHFAVGLDAGGSKTHLHGECAETADQIERRGPGANPNRVGLEEAAGVLVDLVEDALRDCPAPDQVSVCAGVSGAGRAEEQDALAEALRTALASDWTVHVEVVHDALIALDAAYDTDSGVVVIAGTGSVVLGRTRDGTLLRVGGWGHLLGDPGSGYAIGRAGLRAVAAAFDGGDDTVLRERLHDQFGIGDREQLIHAVYRDGLSMQDVAPLVVDAAANDDAAAVRILTEAADGLAEHVGWLVHRSEAIAPRITLLGGMTQNDRYDQVLRRSLHDHFPDWSVRQLQTDPVTGALRRARRLLRGDAACRP